MRIGFVYLFLIAGLTLPLYSSVFGYCFYIFANLFRPLNFAYSSITLPLHGLIAPGVLVFSFVKDFVSGKTISLRALEAVKYMILFVLWCGISAAFSAHYIPEPWEYYLVIIKIVLPILLIYVAITDMEQLILLSWCVALPVALWAVQGAIWGIVKGGPQIEMGIKGGQMSDRNDFIVGVITIIPMLWYLAGGANKRIVRWVGYFAAILSIVCVLVSNSRGGLLGLFFLLLVFLYQQRTHFRRMALYGLVIVFSGALFTPDYVWERLSTIELQQEQTDSSASERMDAMAAGWQCFKSNPILGVGPGNWIFYAPNYLGKTLEPHSIWVKCAAETGTMGMVFYLSMIVSPLVKLSRVKKQGDPHNHPFADMFSLSIIGFCLTATFVNQTYSELFFIVLALASKYTLIENQQC